MSTIYVNAKWSDQSSVDDYGLTWGTNAFKSLSTAIASTNVLSADTIYVNNDTLATNLSNVPKGIYSFSETVYASSSKTLTIYTERINTTGTGTFAGENLDLTFYVKNQFKNQSSKNLYICDGAKLTFYKYDAISSWASLTNSGNFFVENAELKTYHRFKNDNDTNGANFTLSNATFSAGNLVNALQKSTRNGKNLIDIKNSTVSLTGGNFLTEGNGTNTTVYSDYDALNNVGGTLNLTTMRSLTLTVKSSGSERTNQTITVTDTSDNSMVTFSSVYIPKKATTITVYSNDLVVGRSYSYTVPGSSNTATATATIKRSELTAANDGSTTVAVRNEAELNITDAKFVVGDAVHNNGRLENIRGTTASSPDNGIIVVTSNGAWTGTANESDPSILQVYGTVTNSNRITVEKNSRFSVTGSVTNTGTNTNPATITISGSTFSAGSLTNGTNGTFQVATGTSASTLNIGTLNGQIDLQDGAIIKDSTISTAGTNATLNVATGSVGFTGTNAFGATAIDNTGTITVDGTLTAGAVTNNAGGSFTVNTGATLNAASVSNANAFTVNGTLAAGTVTNTGTITIDGAASLTAASLTGGTINLSTEPVSSVRTGAGNPLVSVTGDSANLNSVTLTVNGGEMTSTVTINDSEYILRYTDKKIYLVTKAVLYVKDDASYTGEDGIHFSSFISALQQASALTTGADPVESVRIVVESDIAHDSIPAGDGSLDLTFAGDIIVENEGGDHTVTIDGSRYLRLGANDAETSFVFNPDFVFTGGYGLLFGTSPANFLGTVTVNGTITTDNRFQVLTDSLTLNNTVTAGYAYLAAHNMTLTQPVAAQYITFDGSATADKNVTLTLPTGVTTGNIYIMSDDADVTISGTDGDFETVYQVNTGTLDLVGGKLTTQDTHIHLQNLGFTDDWNRGTPVDPEQYTFAADIVLNSDNTVWDIDHDLLVRFYTAPAYIAPATGVNPEDPVTKAVLNFTNSTVNISGNAINAPYSTTNGTNSVDLLSGSPAMTISLTDSTMTVGGYLENAGTINLSKGTAAAGSTLTVNGTARKNGTTSVENTGTISVEDSTFTVTAGNVTNSAGARITISYSSFTATGTVTNTGTFEVAGESTLNIGTLDGQIDLQNGAIIADSTITTGTAGTLNIGTGKTVSFTSTSGHANSFASTAIDNTGTVSVGGTLTAGAVTNNADGDFTVNTGATLNAGAVTNNAGGDFTVNNGATLNAASVTNANTFTVYGTLGVTGAGTLENTGTFNFTNGSTLNAASATVTNTGADTFQVSGESTLEIGTLNGQIDLQAGASITDSTISTAGTGARLNIATGSVTFTGANDFGATAIDNTGTVTVSGNLRAGTVSTNEATFQVAAGTDARTLKIDTLDGTITLKNGVTIHDSTISHAGTNGSTLKVSSGSVGFTGTNEFGTSSITNSGTITVNGTLSAGSVSNAASSTISFVDTSSTIGDADALNEIIDSNSNAAVSNPSDKQAIPVVLTNSGTIRVEKTSAGSSTLTVNGSLTNKKEVKVLNGGELNVKGVFRQDDNASVLNVTDATFKADNFNSAGGKSTASATFTDSTVEIGKDTTTVMPDGNVFANDGVVNVAASSDTKTSALTIYGNGKNTRTLKVTSSLATLSVTGLTEPSTGTVDVTVGGTLYKDVAVTDGTLTLSSSAFTVGNSYTLTIGETDYTGVVATMYSGDSILSSITVNGTFANTSNITVDAYSSFSATSVTNNGGTFKFVHNPGLAGDATNIHVDSFNNTGGTIVIDISAYLDNPTAANATISGLRISDPTQKGTITLNDGAGNTVKSVNYELNENNEIVLRPGYIFVNARWNETDGAYGDKNNKTKHKLTYNGVTYDLVYNSNAFDNVQAAINAAGENGTIVFFNTSNSGNEVADFKFDEQGTVTVTKNLKFETNTVGKAVKLDALKIAPFCTAEFRHGLYSLEDFLDNYGTLKIDDTTRFNADLVKNSSGTITVDKSSRLVAASIDAGIIEVQTGFGNDTDLEWILRPYAAKIGDNATIRLVYPKTDSAPLEQTGVVHEQRYINGLEQWVVVEDISPASGINKTPIYVKKDTDPTSPTYNRYIYCGSADHISEIPSGAEAFYLATEYGGLQMISDKFDLTPGAETTDPYTTAAIYVQQTYDGGTTFTAKSQDLGVANHQVTVSSTYGDQTIVYNSFIEAMHSAYVKGHSIGTPEEGMIIRLQDGTYTGDVEDATLGFGTLYNIIVEPDRYWDEDSGQWHYDTVSLALTGSFDDSDSADLMTFYKLKNMTIDNWVIGRNSSGRTSVINFVDIDNLTINTKLKAEGGATVRILNCNVTSNHHFSVTGGTFIIENSCVRLVGASNFGSMSTENNWVGSGTIVVRNSQFILEGNSSGPKSGNPVVVNLKINAEFTISGTCTIDGVFTNLDEGSGSNTTIAFRDAILGEDTNIRGRDEEDVGAALRFEGYNVLDGSSVQQNGSKDMTIETGATVEMSDGAYIGVGGEVEVSNLGNITLNNSSISAGSFTNEGSLTLTDGSEITLSNTGTGFTNTGTLTVELHSDGSLGINLENGNPAELNNTGTVYLDLSHADLPEEMFIDLTSLSGDGEVIIIGGGGEYHKAGTVEGHETYGCIELYSPPTRTLYVNGEWSNTAVYKRGTNVGSYTYFGHNAFEDNPDDDQATKRDLKFTTDTSNVVYYGGNATAYSALNLSAADTPNQLTLTTVGSMSTAKLNASFDVAAGVKRTVSVVVKDANGRTLEKQSYEVGASETATTFSSKLFYSSRMNLNDAVAVKTTTASNHDVLSTEPGYTVSVIDGSSTNSVASWDVTYLSGVELVINNADNNAIKLDRSDTKDLYITIYVTDDDTGKVVETQTLVYDKKTTSNQKNVWFQNIRLYSDNLDAEKLAANKYTIRVVAYDGTQKWNSKTTSGAVWTWNDLATDRDTVKMGTLTTDTNQTVTLSGATMNLAAASTSDPAIVNNGTLKAGIGESAVLEIPVAETEAIRNVKVKIQIGTNEEYHMVQAEKNTDSVIVESKSLAPGQQYTVSVSDIQQISAENGIGGSAGYKVLNVNVAPKDKDRIINVTAQTSDGVKFTFTNVKVAPKLVFALDSTAATIEHVTVNGAGDYTATRITDATDPDYGAGKNYIIVSDDFSTGATYNVAVASLSFNESVQAAASSSVTLDSHLALDNTSGTVTGAVTDFSVVVDADGNFNLVYQGIEPLQVENDMTIGAYVQKTVGDGIVRFDCTFNVKAGTTLEHSQVVDTVSTRFSDEDYYYVESEEPGVIVESTVKDGITDSDIESGNITNYGTLVVSSQQDIGKLSLSGIESGEARKIRVTVTDTYGFTIGTYDVDVAENATTVLVVSSDFLAGKTYSASVTDALYLNGQQAANSASKKLVFELLSGSATTIEHVTVNGAGDYTAKKVLDDLSPDYGKYVIFSDGFTVGYDYTVEATVSDSATVQAASSDQLVFALDTTADTVEHVTINGAGDYTATRITTPGDDFGKYYVSGAFTVGNKYTVAADVSFAGNSIQAASGAATAPKLVFDLDSTAENVTVKVLDSNGAEVGTYTPRNVTGSTYSIVSSEFAVNGNYTITYGTKTAQATAVAGGTAPQLDLTLTGLAAGKARTVTAVVKDNTGKVVGTFDVDIPAGATTMDFTRVSSEFSTTMTYTVSVAGEKNYGTEDPVAAIAGDPRKAAKLVLDVDVNPDASRWIQVVVEGETYSLFVEKGASKAELASEKFTVGTDYSSVQILDVYSVTLLADSTGQITLTGLSSSDNVIRPFDENAGDAGEYVLQRTLSGRYKHGSGDWKNFSNAPIVTDEYGNTTAVIPMEVNPDPADAGSEFVVEVTDDKTVVATAETLSVFTSTGTVTNNKTITVTDATFNAATLSNESTGEIMLTNALFNVGTLNADGELTDRGAITNIGSITMDVNSLITAESIDNSNGSASLLDDGTITVDASLFNPENTDMKKIIDLDNSSAGTFTGKPLVISNAGSEDIGILYDRVEHDYWIVAAKRDTVYVNSAWAVDPETGLAYKDGDNVGTVEVGTKTVSLYYGYNAFGSFTDAYQETLSTPYELILAQYDEDGNFTGNLTYEQTIQKIEIYGEAGQEQVQEMLFLGGKAQGDLEIAAHLDSGSTAISIVPVDSDDHGFTLTPRGTDALDKKTITIDSGVTIQTKDYGSIYLGGDADTTTTGTVKVNGTVDAAGEIRVYGKTEVDSGTLKAGTLTVTVANLLTVSGTSTLTIGNLTGNAIQLDSSTALQNSSITSASANGVINAASGFTFSGDTNSLTGISVTATDQTVTNTSTLTVDWQSRITAAGSGNGRFRNTGTGNVIVDAESFDVNNTTFVTGGLATVIDVDAKGDALSLSNVSLKDTAPAGVKLVQKLDGDICVGIIDQSTVYVYSGWSGQTGEEVSTPDGVSASSQAAKYFGINAFSKLTDALEANVASKIVLLDSGLTETQKTVAESPNWGDLLYGTSLTNTVQVVLDDDDDPQSVNFALTARGSDLCLSPVGADKLTIGNGIDLNFSNSTSTGRIWLIYRWNDSNVDPNTTPTPLGSIVLGGTITNAKQTWFGGNVTLTETARVVQTGQVCFRSGSSGDADAVVTLTGAVSNGNQAENALITTTGALEFTSGNVLTTDTYIKGGKFQISDAHWHSDSDVSVDSTNTTWDVSGDFTCQIGSGVSAREGSGFKDTILLKTGSLLKVGNNADVSGLVTMTLTDTSAMNVTGNMTNLGSITIKNGDSAADIANDGKASSLTAANLANKSLISVNGADSSIGLTGTLTNGGAILVLKVPMKAGSNGGSRNVSVTLTDTTDSTKSFNSTAKVYDHESASETGGNMIYAVLEFAGAIADGTYTLTVTDAVSGVTYPETITVTNGQIVNETTGTISGGNASISLSNGATFEGVEVMNNAGAAIMITDSEFESNKLTNYGYITVSGSNARLMVPASTTKAQTIPATNLGEITLNSGASETGAFYNAGIVTVRNAGTTLTVDSLTNSYMGQTSKIDVYDGAQFTSKGDVANSASTSIIVTDAQFTAGIYSGETPTFTGSKFSNSGTLTVTNSTFKAGSVENLADTSTITITNSAFDAGELNLTYGISMDWKSTLSFTGFNTDSSYIDKLKLVMTDLDLALPGLRDYDAAHHRKKLIDYTGTGAGWTEQQYRDLLKDTEWKTNAYTLVVLEGDLYVQVPFTTVYVDTFTGESDPDPMAEKPTFNTLDGSTNVSPSKIIVVEGTQGSICYFNEITTEITDQANPPPEESKKPTFTKGVFGGSYVTTQTKADLGQSISMTVNDGNFQKIVMFGDRIASTSNNLTIGEDAENKRADIVVNINDGTFGTTVVAGDRLESGGFTRYGDVTLNISGGKFASTVAGGHIFSETTIQKGTGTIHGDVYVNISGGSFGADGWLYGGSVANTSANGCYNVITGNVTTTVDASSGAITLNNVVVGSHGRGEIQGNATLILKGSGANLTMNGQIWGGCTGDYYEIDDETGKRTMVSLVDGNRTLSFTGFNGALNCMKIRQFSHIEFIHDDSKDGTAGDSLVTLNNNGVYDLSDISNWTFDNGSSLQGNFKNDFAGDTLFLNDYLQSGTPYVLITDLDSSDGKNVFAGFDQIASIYLGKHEVSINEHAEGATTLSWAAGSDSSGSWAAGSLSIVGSGTTKIMQLSLA